jgi:hypothetical protein
LCYRRRITRKSLVVCFCRGDRPAYGVTHLEDCEGVSLIFFSLETFPKELSVAG